MYQALVIKPEQRREQRIVLLEPPLRNPGTLGLALNSHQYDQFFGLIFSGDDTQILKVTELLDSRDWQFNTYSETQKLYEAVKKFILEDCGCNVEYEHIPKAWEKTAPNDKAMRVYKGLDTSPIDENMNTVVIRDDLLPLQAYAATHPDPSFVMAIAADIEKLVKADFVDEYMPTEALDEEIVEAQTQKLVFPSVATKPKLMNPKAMAQWKYVMETYKTQISKYGKMKSLMEKSSGTISNPTNPNKQEYARMIAMWRAALYLFKRKCIKDGLPPYTVSDALSTHYNKPDGFGAKIKASYHKARDHAKSILETLKKSDRLETIGDLKFDEVGKSSARYYISVYIDSKIAKKYSFDEIKEWLVKEKHYTKGKEFFKHPVDSVADVIIQPFRTKGMSTFIVLYFTNENVKMMLGVQELTPTSTLRALRKIGMTLAETGELTI